MNRYLAAGDSQVSMSYEFGVGTSTVSQIISETCKALWTKLAPLVLPVPKSQDWEKSENNFRRKWNFPNCVGAINGKHVIIQVSFNNYKTQNLIVILVKMCVRSNSLIIYILSFIY